VIDSPPIATCGRRRHGRSSPPTARCGGSPSTTRASSRSTRASSRSRRKPGRGRAMRREGSPWQGLGSVYAKELAEHLSSIRMLVLEILFSIVACIVVIFAIAYIRQNVPEDPFVLLKLFTSSQKTLLSLQNILAFLLPVMAIALGFD